MERGYEIILYIISWSNHIYVTQYLLQFLLVTGGWSSFYSSISDETEIFTEAQASWRILSARLPVPVYVPKAVSIDNKVLLFGNNTRVWKRVSGLTFFKVVMTTVVLSTMKSSNSVLRVRAGLLWT